MIIIETSDGGIIKLQLDEKAAPITVANFRKLVNQNFYDGLIFHRVIKGFMIQGGDPTGTGMGGSNKRIKGEFLANGINNPLKHSRGVISMARSQHPDSASSQFFIMHQDSPHLDGSYAAFGKVIEGIEVVDNIANCKTDWRDKPIVEQKIKRIYEI
ncbi:MAG TPA: peptidylprolyl isomerase [Erysipelotrichaceae bacterium]|nr:peptidylprolyl isomerase [Erysipelotrichaceae bacterium]HQA84800.1 peptidylprolyl isomerase [Erysipelotrichaceae bacterium]